MGFTFAVPSQLVKQVASVNTRFGTIGGGAMMVKAIVGLEIEITKLVGKVKLSQNKEARDRQSAADALEARDERLTAQAMRATLNAQD